MTGLEMGRKTGRTGGGSGLVKRVLIVIGGVFGLLAAAAIVVPLVVDVDKYRPTIVSKANEQLNGKVELGHLGLSLWGQVKIDIDGLKLADASGRTVVQVKDASFRIPLLSLLTGRPEIRLQLVSPQINVLKQRNGKYNLATLMKEKARGEPPAPPAREEEKKAAPAAGAPVEIPQLLQRGRYTVLLEHAKVSYVDETTRDTYNVSELNFALREFSLEGDMPFEVSAEVDMLVQKKIKVAGALVLTGNTKATRRNGVFDSATVRAALKLDGLEIVNAPSFHKKKGVPLGADLEAKVGTDSFEAPVIKFRLADVVIDGQASGKTADEITRVNFKAQSNQIDLAKLGELSPMLKEYGVTGQLALSVFANGPTNSLDYGADAKLSKMTLTHESMKQALEVNATVAVATDRIRGLTAKLTAKDFDVAVSGTMENFLRPRFKFRVNSTNMDLDGLLKASAKAAEARKTEAKAVADGGAAPAPAAGKVPVVDYNAMFKPLRENAVAAASAGTLDFSFRRIKSTGVVLEDTKGELALNDLMLALKGFSTGVFDGTVKGGMSFNVKPAKPEVGTNLMVSGLQTKSMLESQVPFARNTVKGAISASVNIGGAGLNQSDVISGWKGNGTLEMKPAMFSTLDLGKQVRDGVIAKLPDVVKSKIRAPDNLVDWHGDYETFSTKFALASGVLSINEINGKAYPNKGMDMKGSGTVKLADYGLDMTVHLIDTYQWFKADDLARDDRFGHFAVSPRVTGTLFSPRFDWGSTVTKLAENAAKSQAKQQLKKALGDKIPGNIKKPEDVVKGLKGLFGR